MTVYDIIDEHDRMVTELENNYSMNSDLNEFTNKNCSDLSIKHNIKESQAMFLVMTAIRDFFERYM